MKVPSFFGLALNADFCTSAVTSNVNPTTQRTIPTIASQPIGSRDETSLLRAIHAADGVRLTQRPCRIQTRRK
jgi:hypothetical protein